MAPKQLPNPPAGYHYVEFFGQTTFMVHINGRPSMKFMVYLVKDGGVPETTIIYGVELDYSATPEHWLGVMCRVVP